MFRPNLNEVLCRQLSPGWYAFFTIYYGRKNYDENAIMKKKKVTVTLASLNDHEKCIDTDCRTCLVVGS